MAILELREVSYLYSQDTMFEKAAIQDINLSVEAGEFVGVIGHTGSGKSTLVQHLNGLLRPTAGQVLVGGEDIWAKPKEIRKYRFKVGLVFQYPEHQLFEETVYKDIAFGPKNMGLPKEEIDKRVAEAVRLVGVPLDILKKSPFELSGGQKRRVAIAGVIAMEPEILVLDEPTAGLDPEGKKQILDMVKAYHEEKNNTVLFVSHSMEDIASYAKKVLVLNQSKVYLFDTVREVFSHAKELEALGLTVPQITKIFGELAAQGYPVNPNVYTIAEAKQELLALLGTGGGSRA